MSQNKQRLSWLEMLKVNKRAYLLFYKRYPRMILSRFALIIWKALTPYVGIYFSALIIEELAGAKNPGRIRFLVLLTLFLIASGSLVTALLGQNFLDLQPHSSALNVLPFFQKSR